MTTPLQPFVASSVDSCDTALGRVTMVACVDSNNKIFIKVPIFGPNGAIQYKYFVLNTAATGYPTGTIKDITISISYQKQAGIIIFQLGVDTGDIYVYDPTTSSNGSTIYTWTSEEPPAMSTPLLPNPWGNSLQL